MAFRYYKVLNHYDLHNSFKLESIGELFLKPKKKKELERQRTEEPVIQEGRVIPRPRPAPMSGGGGSPAIAKKPWPKLQRKIEGTETLRVYVY